MSTALISEGHLTNIANGVRTIVGENITYTPNQMASAIDDIAEEVEVQSELIAEIIAALAQKVGGGSASEELTLTTGTITPMTTYAAPDAGDGPITYVYYCDLSTIPNIDTTRAICLTQDTTTNTNFLVLLFRANTAEEFSIAKYASRISNIAVSWSLVDPYVLECESGSDYFAEITYCAF